MDQVHIDQDQVDELMRDENGPVGDLMKDLARQMEDIARAKAPVLSMRNVRSARSTALVSREGTVKTPGYLKRNITSTVGHSKLHNGYLFAGANAPGDPGIFLEEPAPQMHEKHPFLTTGLWDVQI